MKPIFRTSILMVLVVVLASTLAAASAPSNPFRGKWKGVDPVDESNLKLRLTAEPTSGGNVFSIDLYDDRCNACGESYPPARGQGFGILTSPTHIDATIIWWSLDSGQTILGPLNLTYDFDFDTMTITESYGGWYEAVYHRSNSPH